MKANFLHLVLDVIYDVDETLTLRAKHVSAKLEVLLGIPITLQSLFIATTLTLTAIGFVLTSAVLGSGESMTMQETIKRTLFYSLYIISLLGSITVFPVILKAVHLKVDRDTALGEKSYGDGYHAWSYLLSGMIFTALVFALLPKHEIVAGLVYAGFYINFAFLMFVIRKGNNKPRRRRQLLREIVKSIRERLTDRALAPQSM